MMMQTYCASLIDTVGASPCTRSVRYVNSPRMSHRSRRLRIPGTAGVKGGFEFTALAARGGTKSEERILRLVVRLWA